MTERWVALVTGDPVLYGEIASFLRDQRIPTVSLLPGQRVPRKVSVVITSREERRRVHFPRVLIARPGELTTLAAALRQALESDESASLLWVGVDPGPRPGYAVVRPDGASLVEGVAASPEAVAPIVRQILRGFPRARVLIRVGNGDALRRSRIVNALLPLGVPLELAPEEGTTPSGRPQNDPLAARAIACIPGARVVATAPLRITPGEIGNLQRISREMSGGKFTLPREMAASVLEGSTTLGEAMSATAEKLERASAPATAPRASRRARARTK